MERQIEMAKPRVDLILAGRLERVVLNSLSFEKLPTASATGSATITTKFEVGVKTPKADGFMVAVEIALAAIDSKSGEVGHTAKAKMTGYYALPKEMKTPVSDEFTDAATERGRLQVYPLVRHVLSSMANLGGLGLKDLDYEPRELQKASEPARPNPIKRRPRKKA